MTTANQHDLRFFQAMVSMRDGVKLNTFVYLPRTDQRSWPVILQRTPYGITSSDGKANTDCTRGWLPAADAPMRGSILRGYRNIVARGYAAVYQDTRGRYGSEGEDRVYADDACDGYDTLEWIARQPWCNGMIGMSGSSAGATTTFAAASRRHPNLRAFFAQVGASSIYDDVVYEGNAIEMERLWLWVAKNIPGLSQSHRQAVMRRFGIDSATLDRAADAANMRYARLDAARHDAPPFVTSEDWLRLPLSRYPDFATWQPFLDEILAHPAPDAFRRRHDFRSTIDVPGFHATTWYDIFQTSVIAAFNDIQARAGNQLLWIGPNDHYFIYETNFWPRDPYFEWFDYWLKGEATGIMDQRPVFYSPRAWVEDRGNYIADDWRHAERWPLPASAPQRFYLCGDGSLKPPPRRPVGESERVQASLYRLRPTYHAASSGRTPSSTATRSRSRSPRMRAETVAAIAAARNERPRVVSPRSASRMVTAPGTRRRRGRRGCRRDCGRAAAAAGARSPTRSRRWSAGSAARPRSG